MTLLAPIALGTIATVSAVVGALLVVAYILKMRRRRFEVPFATLWHRLLKERESTALWKHLRRLLSLLLALTIAGLLLFAATEPRLGFADKAAKNVVIIVDASASMKTVEENAAPRLQLAKERVLELIDSFGGGDEAMVMAMDKRATPLTRFENDHSSLKKATEGIRASDTAADLRSALFAASAALRGRQNPTIVVVGDGAYEDGVLGDVRWDAVEQVGLSDINLGGIKVFFERIGRETENAGIIAFNVRRYITNRTATEVYIEVRNFGTAPTRRRLLLYDGDTPIETSEIELKAGEALTKVFPSGGASAELRAVLLPMKSGEDDIDELARDAFAVDDEAVALVPEQKVQDVLLVTLDNLYLEGAMLIYDNVRVDKMTPEEFEAAMAGPGLPVDYGAVVFDDYTPEVLPKAHVMLFNPDPERSPFGIAGTMANPRITDTNDDHPSTRWLMLGDTHFDKTKTFNLDRAKGDVALVRSLRSTVGISRRQGRYKLIAFGFSLTGTDLVLRVAFPLLLANGLDWFAGEDADLLTTYRTGQRIRLPLDSAAEDGAYLTRRDPAGAESRAPLRDGYATFVPEMTGVHTLIHNGTSELRVAANLASPLESDISPSSELIMGGQSIPPPSGFTATRSQSIWYYLALLVLLLLAAEWLSYNRRISV